MAKSIHQGQELPKTSLPPPSAAGQLTPPPMTTPRCRRLFFIRPYVLGACDAEAAVVGAEQAGEGLPPLGSYEASDAGFSG